MSIKVAIIGFAGRQKDIRLTQQLFVKACEKVETYLTEHYDLNNLSLVSGGSAWMDHVAVVLAFKLKLPLILLIPSKFRHGRFVPDEKVPFNPGKRLNYLHRKFSQICSLNSLSDLSTFKKAMITVPGFHARNREIVTNSNFCLACTLDHTITGGTFNTWSQFDNGKKHQIILK